MQPPRQKCGHPEGGQRIARFDIALAFDHFDWSCDYYLKHGQMMPDDWKAQIGSHEAIFFGAVGWPEKVPDHACGPSTTPPTTAPSCATLMATTSRRCATRRSERGPRMSICIRRLAPDDIDDVMTAGHLFDDPPRRDWTAAFLAHAGHHLLLALVDDEPAGFVTGIECLHTDKGAEMLLYALGVDDAFRRRGVGRSLVVALGDLAVERGCRQMWVPIELDNEAAVATYLSAGAGPPEPASTMSWEFEE